MCFSLNTSTICIYIFNCIELYSLNNLKTITRFREKNAYIRFSYN